MVTVRDENRKPWGGTFTTQMSRLVSSQSVADFDHSGRRSCVPVPDYSRLPVCAQSRLFPFRLSTQARRLMFQLSAYSRLVPFHYCLPKCGPPFFLDVGRAFLLIYISYRKARYPRFQSTDPTLLCFLFSTHFLCLTAALSGSRSSSSEWLAFYILYPAYSTSTERESEDGGR